MQQYQIISGNTIATLTGLIQFAFHAGWQLQGGVTYDGTSYIQAMYKS